MSDISPLISDLAFILIIAGFVTILFRWIKQPVILGYIVAGIMAGPHVSFLPTVSDPANIKIWGDIGIIFLLFSMGLGFSFRKLMNVGITALVTTVVIVCGMMFLGYTAGNAMGFSHMSSIFLGGMLSMSSTAIVYKAFGDMGLLQQKFTGIVLGILVVEDLVAVVMLVVLSTLGISKHFEEGAMLESVLKLAAFLIFWFALGIYLIPTAFRKFQRFLSDEILLIVSLALCLGMVMIATKAGFSAALGAFVMGSLLAETAESDRIGQLVQPVKDLFAAVFFVSVGMMVDPIVIWQYIFPILILTLLVLGGQVLFGSFGVLLSGQPLKIAVQSGFSLTQVGEFAFIIASLGVSLHVTDNSLYPVIVAVSVITTFLTPYMIRCSDPAYRIVERYLPMTMKEFLVRYSSGTMTVHHQSLWTHLLKSMFIPVGIYLVICIFFATLFFSYIQPLILEHLPGVKGNMVGFAIIFPVIAPLLWAVIVRKNHSPEFRKLWADSKFNRGSLVSLVLIKIILCIAVIMGVLVRLFNVALGAGVVLSTVIVGAIYFSKWVQRRSTSIEDRFLKNFQGDKNSPARTVLNGAMPFANLHMTDITISPDSPCVGQTLQDLCIRTKFQVNVISIVRGNQRIDIPDGTEHLYPHDRITLAGTDEQLERFKCSLQPAGEQKPKIDRADEEPMRIMQLSLDSCSPLVNRSIREVALQNCIVLGIERNGKNLMNPEPETVFRENDMIWLVGKQRAVESLN